MASPKKLAHVVLFTTQVQTMRDWWKTVLDARLVMENPAMAFLTYDDEHHRIALMDPEGAAKLAPAGITQSIEEAGAPTPLPAPNPEAVHVLPIHQERGLGHIAFTYESLGDLLENYERLRLAGITPALPINHGLTTSFYYIDPDGNRVELQIDNFDTAEEIEEFLANITNFIGIPIDPDDMLARFRAGTPVEELLAFS